jgi:hypothetical protein
MAVPAELMAMLQGGGGAPQGDMSPAQQLEAGGGAPAAPAPPSPPTDGAAGAPFYGGGGIGDNVDALRSALDALQQYASGEDDEQNIQTVLKCVTALQGILAAEEKMVDGAMAGKADGRAMRKLAGGGSAGPQY